MKESEKTDHPMMLLGDASISVHSTLARNVSDVVAKFPPTETLLTGNCPLNGPLGMNGQLMNMTLCRTHLRNISLSACFACFLAIAVSWRIISSLSNNGRLSALTKGAQSNRNWRHYRCHRARCNDVWHQWVYSRLSVPLISLSG